MKKIITLAMLCSIAAGANAATTGSAFLKIIPGAREQGVAGAATALGGTLTSAWANPASAAKLEKRQAALSHVELIENAKLEFAAFSHEGFGGRLFYGFTYLHYAELEGRDINGSLTGNFTAYDMALQAGYARQMGALSVGFAVKGVRNKIENESGNGFGLDAGAVYDFEKFRLGLAAVNVGRSGKVGSINESLPATVALGAAVPVYFITLTADAKRNIAENRTTLAGGGEITLLKLLGLRAGYSRDITNKDKENADAIKGFNAGFGLDLSICTIDYAYTHQGELGQNHRFTLSAKF